MKESTYADLQLLQLDCNRLLDFVDRAKKSYSVSGVPNPEDTVNEYAILGALYSIRSRIGGLSKKYCPSSWKKIEDNYFHKDLIASSNYSRMLRDLEKISINLVEEVSSLLDGKGSSVPERQVIPFATLPSEQDLTLDTQYVGLFEVYRHELTKELYDYLKAFEMRSFGEPGSQVMLCHVYESTISGFVVFGANGDPMAIYSAMAILISESGRNLAFLGLRSTEEHLRNPADLLGLDVLEEAETFEELQISWYAKSNVDALFKKFSKIPKNAAVWATKLETVESLCRLGTLSQDDRNVEHIYMYRMVESLSHGNMQDAFANMERTLKPIDSGGGYIEERGAFTAPRVLVHYILLDRLMDSGFKDKLFRRGSRFLNFGE